MQERFAELHQEVLANPASLRRTIQSLHTSREENLIDFFIDGLLGIPIFESGTKPGVKQQYSSTAELSCYRATPYNVIREALHILQPQPDDIVYDLGSGNGKFVIYAALTTQARFIGIELSSDRVAIANAVKDRFSIENATFIEGNVRDVSFKDGTIFYLYQPFADKTLAHVIERLRKIASTRDIRVVTYWYYETEFTKQPWLRQKYIGERGGRELRIFESNYLTNYKQPF